MNNRVLSVLNMIGVIIVLTMNGLANALPINGKTTGELSDQYPNLFVPAGLTFSIWGIIYLLLISFTVYQLVIAFRKEDPNQSIISKISILYLLSCAANASWIVAWHYQEVPLSLIIMLILLTSLVMIYQRLEIGRKRTESNIKYLVHVPFSIYLGWISIATIANVTTLLVDINWDGFGISEATWASMMIMTGTFITAVIILQRRDFFYALVVLWAFLGIVLKRSGFDTNADNQVLYVAIICMILITGISMYRMVKKSTRVDY